MIVKDYILKFVIEECCECGIPFAISEHKYNELQESKNTFYCPNGHGQFYTKSSTSKLKEQIKRLKTENQWIHEACDRLSAQISQAKNDAKTAKSAKTRMLNRIKNGICPCCNRHFDNIHEHMKSKHKELFK